MPAIRRHQMPRLNEEAEVIPLKGIQAVEKLKKPAPQSVEVFTLPAIVPKSYKLWVTPATGQAYFILWDGPALEGADFMQSLKQAKTYSRFHISGYNEQGLSKIIHLDEKVLNAA